jgi:predicted membrane channel-forming protein YqfA (hemolysin III family)
MAKQKHNVLTGGMILITLGVLIYLSKAEIYPFRQTWPILLIVVGICTLIQRVKDVGGWFITIVGVLFLITECYGFELYKLSQYILPAILVLIGVYILVRRRKHDS